MEINREDYFIRQNGIFDLEQLGVPILIVGAGTIGSFTALALAKLGCMDIAVQDHDTIEIHNLSNQLYTAENVGQNKAEALVDNVRAYMPPGGNIRAITTEYDGPPDIDYQVNVSAVDNMNTRMTLFGYADHLFIDGRMGDNALEIYTIDCEDPKDVAFYHGTLFPDDEALPIECSRRSVAYNGFIIGGYMAMNIVRRLTGQEVPRELILDLNNYLLMK